jgi:hypothetical protein
VLEVTAFCDLDHRASDTICAENGAGCANPASSCSRCPLPVYNQLRMHPPKRRRNVAVPTRRDTRSLSADRQRQRGGSFLPSFKLLYSASCVARRPLIDEMSIRKKTGSIDRSLVCSRLSASGFLHHSENCASSSRACFRSVGYCGSPSSK